MSATHLPNGYKSFGPKANCTLEGLRSKNWGFMASMIGGCLLEIVGILHVDRSISRFNPRLCYFVFIPCDIVSLILQATGGALSSIASDKAAVQRGVNVSLAGLIFQVVCLVAFCALFADYLIICMRTNARQRMTKNMKIFLAFLFISTILILVRCSYRIEELKEGYFSPMFRDQPLFIGLESS
ncbi:hypothetical protein COL516b_001874 [Colletotrichum fioriniae]|nr:uncharacterized protein COL516b_001874 [Colletotrichum fioriniae]KAJ0311170.1 hypothetical protein COL516b_001874 [Colletotrichum fioriniae]